MLFDFRKGAQRVSRRKPLTETPRHGEKFPLGTPTSSSASSLRSGFSFASFAPAHVASGCLRQAVLVRILSRMSHPTGCYYAAYRAKAQVAWFPASARWHVFMYAGFNRIAPDQDTGMDLYEPWVTALGLFNAGGKSASDIWTYCHKSIYQPPWFLGMDQAGGLPLYGNAEVLLGPFAHRCQQGRWPSHPY